MLLYVVRAQFLYFNPYHEMIRNLGVYRDINNAKTSLKEQYDAWMHSMSVIDGVIESDGMHAHCRKKNDDDITFSVEIIHTVD